MTTFAAVLTDLLRRDPGRPLVTFYDDASGERVELSVATFANWVAKTSSLLVEELDGERGGSIRIDLPTHWLAPVFLGAAWTVGLVVTQDDEPDIVVCGPDSLTRWQSHPAALACSLRPLGTRFVEPLPAGVRDFGVEVWSQPDAFVPWDPPGPEDLAVEGATHAALFAERGAREPGCRLLTTANPASPDGLTSFTGPLLAGGSTVWVRHPDPTTWQHRYDEERATASDQPARS
ncbi:conserved hypothetical protein [metagenome]|uniref:TIGR03089 family protein n=1 Tax=metagenome TaxID=256318 RepID=A0A2P2CBT6_9ZZZZ